MSGLTQFVLPTSLDSVGQLRLANRVFVDFYPALTCGLERLRCGANRT